MRVFRLALIMALLFPFAYFGLLPVQAVEPSKSKTEVTSSQDALPVSKRAFAQFLVNRFELPTQWVSTFPLFADVELTDPDFVYLDTAYRYHLLFPNNEGYFHPDDPTTQIDAWLALGKVLFPNKKLSTSQLNAILPEITGQNHLQTFQKPRVALLYLAGVLSTEKGDIPLEPNKPITQGWLKTMISTLEATKLLLLDKAQNTLTNQLDEEETSSQTPSIPKKLYFTITPSQAIMGKNLVLNSVVYFQLKEPIYLTQSDASTVTIPAQSSVQGKIVASQAVTETVNRFTVAFQWIRSAENEQLYKLNSTLVFELSTLEPKRSFNTVTRGYLVRGQDVFVVVTE